MDNLHSDLAVPHRKQIRKRKQSFDKLNKDNNIIIEYGYRRQRSYTASNEGYASTDEDPSSDDECSQISKRSRTGGLQKSDSSEWIEIAENLTKTAVICNGSQESVPDSLPELSKDKTKKSVKPEKEQKIKRATKIVLKLKEKKVADKSVDGDSKKIQELSKNEKKLAEKVEVQKSR